MVEKNSATLAFLDEEVLFMDADHSSVCKFDSNESHMCRLACFKIDAAVKRILSLNSETRQPLSQQTRAPAARPVTEDDPPETPVTTAWSSTEMPPPGIKVLYNPANAIVEFVFLP